jgi:putative membrane protein
MYPRPHAESSGMNEMISTGSPFDTQPSVSNHFAWIRTLLGLQRTLMAAVRTSVSLIGFGFTVAQFFEKMRGSLPEGARVVPLNVPRDLGLLLIGAGVVSLVVFTMQYNLAVKYLRSDAFASIVATGEKPLHRPASWVAFAVILIGIAAFISVLLHF